ncbi:hypothetical protein [Chitinophaga filiformis]|uniref:Uncharacterized protein n=1 Tax=Chitinophaga filiformis TaxID=104663 RepID=A0ABY4HV67_CHIFI|nr:hypothetical protein [Chitinophaga filiformis]UPK67502.1 hypothetical protein MYF79_21390 [Chitinophaga filiformis]
MMPLKPVQPTSGFAEERILNPYQYVRLVKTNINAIETAKFIPPPLGSNQILGHVRVKFKPGYRYTTV